MNCTQKRDGVDRPSKREVVDHAERSLVAVGIRKCRFFEADKAVSWAITSYGDALREMHPDEGEPWFEDGVPWGTPVSFADAFLHAFTKRLAREFLAAARWSRDSGVQPMCVAHLGSAALREIELFCAAQKRGLPQRGRLGAVLERAGGA